jgi:hypothetical protein
MAGPDESRRYSVPVISKQSTAHARDPLAREHASKSPVLIPLTEEEHRNALELFATETPEMPKPRHAEAAAVDVSDMTFEHAPLQREEQARRQLTWQAPLLAAIFTAVATLSVLMFVRSTGINNAGQIATSHDRRAENTSSLRESSETTAAPALLASRSIPLFEQPVTSLGSTGLRHEVPVATVSEVLDRRESAVSRTPPSPPPPIPSRAEAIQPRPAPPVQSAPLSTARVAEPVHIPEPRVAPALGSLTLPADVPVEPSPLVARAAGTPRGETNGTALPRMPASETGAIQTVLSQYRTAFRDLDAGAARAIWPSVDAKALGKAFESLERQDLIFNSCQIAVRDVRAVASCDGSARYVPRIGNRDPHDERRSWQFKLRKVDDVWLIDTVSAR